MPSINKENMEIEFWELKKSFHITFEAFYKYFTVSFISNKIFPEEHNSQNNSGKTISKTSWSYQISF